MTNDQLRGWPIYFDNEDKEWKFQDTDESTIETYKNRPCGACGLKMNDGPDPCVGELPGVINACCGHGQTNLSYIQFENGVMVRGFNKVEKGN